MSAMFSLSNCGPRSRFDLLQLGELYSEAVQRYVIVTSTDVEQWVVIIFVRSLCKNTIDIEIKYPAVDVADLALE